MCVVVPHSTLQAPKRPVPSEGFPEAVRCHLCRHRLVTDRVTVEVPTYVDVAAGSRRPGGSRRVGQTRRPAPELAPRFRPLPEEEDDERPYRLRVRADETDVEGFDGLNLYTYDSNPGLVEVCTRT